MRPEGRSADRLQERQGVDRTTTCLPRTDPVLEVQVAACRVSRVPDTADLAARVVDLSLIHISFVEASFLPVDATYPTGGILCGTSSFVRRPMTKADPASRNRPLRENDTPPTGRRKVFRGSPADGLRGR